MWISSLALMLAPQQGPQTVFPTLEAARDYVQMVRGSGLPAGGLSVLVQGGKHFRSAAFELTAADAGEPGKPIVYRAAPGPALRVIGGQEVDPAAFTTLTSASPVWSRVQALAQGQVLSCDLVAEGITNFGNLASKSHGIELSFDGSLMTLARWPNLGDPLLSVTSALSTTVFSYSGSRPERWLTAPDPWAWGLWFYNWRDNHEPILSINPGNKRITLGQAPQYGIQAGQPWYAENLLEELDEPGEWYLERSTGILYFWPPSDLGAGEILLSTLNDRLLRLTDTSYVEFEGLTFELGWGIGIDIQGGSHNVLRQCEIRNTGTWGANIASADSGLDACLVHHTGGRGVDLNSGERSSLTSGGAFVHNSEIHHFGQWQRTYAPAVRMMGGVPSGGYALLAGVGCRVTNNHIHDAPHNAIMYGGNDNLIELNEIHDVCQFSDDAGAIYTGRDWSSHGNLVRHNFIHDIRSPLPPNRVHGIYLDDCDSGDTIYGNVLYRIDGYGVFVGGGRDNLIQNNVLVQCGVGVRADRRGQSSINQTPGSSFNLLARVQQFDYTNPPWSDAYPSLAALLDNGFDAAKDPEGNVVECNIGWLNEEWISESSFGGAGALSFFLIQDNLQDQDPLFIDEGALNLGLQSNSPAYGLPGFQAIPFQRIGRIIERRKAPAAPSGPQPLD